MKLLNIQNISGIYCIENRINGKKYIGKSINILRRVKSHINDLKLNKSECSYLQSSWNKYGEDSFFVYSIEMCSKDNLSEREIFYIKHLNTKRPNGYNLTDGGDGITGFTPSAETIEKLSISHTGNKLTNKAKELLRIANLGDKNPFFGKKHSDETKRIISEKGTGRKLSKESREKKRISTMGNKNPIYERKFENSSSSYFGVSSSDGGYWSAQIRNQGRLFYLGKFKEELSAAICFDLGTIYFNQGRKLNFAELREKYISYLNEYEILDIKQLRKVIKDFIKQEGSKL